MVVAWFSLPLFRRKWDVKPTTGLFGTTFRPAEGGRFLPFSGNLLRMELASPRPFFHEYEIWDCQNIYWKAVRQLQAASFKTLPSLKRTNTMLLIKGGESRVGENR